MIAGSKIVFFNAARSSERRRDLQRGLTTKLIVMTAVYLTDMWAARLDVAKKEGWLYGVMIKVISYCPGWINRGTAQGMYEAPGYPSMGGKLWLRSVLYAPTNERGYYSRRVKMR